MEYCQLQRIRQVGSEMKKSKSTVRRRAIGIVSTSLGLLLFADACFVYMRYAEDPSNSHLLERLQHARMLTLFWNASFFGSLFLIALSLFGLGWSRWIGLVVNCGAFLCSLMIYGAMCGPSGC